MRDLRRLLKYLRPHWPVFTLATFAMVLVGLLESATGALIVPIFDQAFASGAGQRTSTLFGLQRLLIARWLDRNGQNDASLLFAPGSALTGGDSSEAT